MCGCEASFVCYEADAHEPMDTGEFDALINEDTRWTMWEGWR